MKTAFRNTSFVIAVFLSVLFLGLGFLLLHFGLTDYGFAFFLMLPLTLGMSIGALPNQKLAIWGFGTGLTFLLAWMLILGLEGVMCAVLLLPLLLFMMWMGVLISESLKKYFNKKGTEHMPVLLLPLALFFLSIPLENNLTENETAVMEVKDEIVLPYPSGMVYDAIKSVDTVVAEKSLLMYIGLPVPLECTLEKEEEGALRTCYFEGGQIVERITRLERGKILQMDVVDYQLTGRKWLGFREAVYYFEALPGGHTKMTRITTYTSELKPRLYWEPLEKWGIRQEHAYIFRHLKNNLQAAAGR